MQKATHGVRPAGSVGHSTSEENRPVGTLGVPGLVLIGVGGIIGAGFFLGSGLPIHIAGPSVLLAFLLGGLVTAQVIGALATLAVNDPEQGSFMAYARSYIGDYAGFLNGWGYYVASILTIASEAVAMSIFTKLWLPSIPSWCMASAYVLIILAINAFGVKNFGRVESFMSVIKIAALVGFIVYIVFLLANGSLSHATVAGPGVPVVRTGGFFPHGASGIFQSMLIVIFAYGGIGVFATAAPQMRHPQEIDRAAWLTVGSLVFLYLVSIGLLLLVVPWERIGTAHSPFVVALTSAGSFVLAQIFNAVILVASFSVMAGAVFSANQILLGLGNQRDAPHFVTRQNHKGISYGVLAATTASLGVALFVSFLLPGSVYTFLISATSFLTFMNWFLILWSFLSWRRKSRGRHLHLSSLAFGQPAASVVTMLLILAMTGYALLEPGQRFGFFAFLAVALLISGAFFIQSRLAHRRAAS